MAGKYGRPLIDLMAVHPGRQFKMAELVRYVRAASAFAGLSANTVRAGVAIALADFEKAGVVTVIASTTGRGGYSTYRWREKEWP